jgi:hypothetical protein
VTDASDVGSQRPRLVEFVSSIAVFSLIAAFLIALLLLIGSLFWPASDLIRIGFQILFWVSVADGVWLLIDRMLQRTSAKP